MRFTLRIVLAAAATLACPAAEDIPKGYDFPRSEDYLKGLLNRGRFARLRVHSWMVFDGISQPSRSKPDLPIFRTWVERSDIMPPTGALLPLEIGELRLVPPKELALVPGSGPISKRYCQDQVCEAVFFNPEAVKGLTEQKLTDGTKVVPKCAQSLKDLNTVFTNNNVKLEMRDIPGFAMPGSIVVKTAWTLVNSDRATVVNLLNLPRRDDDPPVFRIPGGGYKWRHWPDCVGVKVRPDTPTGAAATCSEGLVGIDEFYHFKLSQDQINAFVSPEPVDSMSRKGKTEYYAVLLSIHVATKETTDWTWSTFWWTRFRDRRYTENRPPSLARRKPWVNYAMDLAYDMNVPQVAPGLPKICFNPFLEGQIEAGTVSNCMSCHRRAAIGYQDADPGPATVFRGVILKNDQEAFPKPSNVLRTDYMWSVALNQSCK
jgi:hypothetical protein